MGGGEVDLKVDEEKGGVKGLRRGSGHGEQWIEL